MRNRQRKGERHNTDQGIQGYRFKDRVNRWSKYWKGFEIPVREFWSLYVGLWNKNQKKKENKGE